MAGNTWRSAAPPLLRLAVALPLLGPASCGSADPALPAGSQPAVQPPGGAGGTSASSVAAGRALVIFGSDTVVAEIARTPEQRERGLMHRREVPDGTGMLFVFTDEAERTFWMSNTFVSLDVAFFDASLRVVDIQQMEAESTDFHDSRVPAMYALEVRKGWLAAHGVRIGTRARLVLGPG